MTPHDKILQNLFNDYISLKQNSLNTMLRNILDCEYINENEKEEFTKDILDVAFGNNPQIEKFIKQSPFLLKNDGFTCVGKYKDWFWISCEDEPLIFYCGTTIQELAYSTNSNLPDIEDQEEFTELINDFIENRTFSENLVKNFLKICNDNGVSFDFAKIKNVKVDKNEERKFIEAVQQEFGFTPEPSYIGQVG